MDLTLLLKGLILGVSVAAPVGPIGVVCINRTINKGYVSGLVSGLGVATADLLFGVIAGLGVSIVSGFLLEHRILFQTIGLICLIYIGVKTLLKKEEDIKRQRTDGLSLVRDYISTFFLTISNPITVLVFVAIFSGLGLTISASNMANSVLLMLGLFTGSGLWWFFLSGVTHKVKNKISATLLRKVDVVSGIVILSFAAYLIYDLGVN